MTTIKFLPSMTRKLFLGFFAMLLCLTVFAQEEEEKHDILHRPLQRIGHTFESIWLIDNQTVLVPLVGTAEMDIMHRFGVVKNGYSDFFGLYAPSNIRLGFNYVPINNLQLGLGFTKDRLLWDFNAKYSILREYGEKISPISLTYYVNMGADTREKDNFEDPLDRLSYFHQIMIAKKLTYNLSAQAAFSFSHFNRVPAYKNDEGVEESRMKNDHMALSIIARYKISDATAFIGGYDQPLTKHELNNPYPNISLGFEIATPLHAFQMFIGNYRWQVPQYNNVFNQNDFSEGEFVIGFNITRLLDMKYESLSHMLLKKEGYLD